MSSIYVSSDFSILSDLDPNITTLLLGRCLNNYDNSALVADALSRNTTVKHLKFHNDECHVEHVKLITDSMNSNLNKITVLGVTGRLLNHLISVKIKKLELTHMKVDDPAIILNNQHLTELTMYGCFTTLSSFGSALSRNNNIHKLDLSRSTFMGGSFLNLCRGLEQNKSIKILRLRSISGYSTESFVRLVQLNNTLQTLDVSYNARIGEIINAVQHGNISEIICKGGNFLDLDPLCVIPSLTSLTIGTVIGKNTVPSIITLMTQLEKIKFRLYSAGKITTDVPYVCSVCSEIIRSLKDNTKLKHLVIDNKFHTYKPQIVSELKEMLKDNYTLESISVKGKSLPEIDEMLISEERLQRIRRIRQTKRALH